MTKPLTGWKSSGPHYWVDGTVVQKRRNSSRLSLPYFALKNKKVSLSFQNTSQVDDEKLIIKSYHLKGLSWLWMRTMLQCQFLLYLVNICNMHPMLGERGSLRFPAKGTYSKTFSPSAERRVGWRGWFIRCLSHWQKHPLINSPKWVRDHFLLSSWNVTRIHGPCKSK